LTERTIDVYTTSVIARRGRTLPPGRILGERFDALVVSNCFGPPNCEDDALNHYVGNDASGAKFGGENMHISKRFVRATTAAFVLANDSDVRNMGVTAIVTGFVIAGLVAAMFAAGNGGQSAGAGPLPNQRTFGASLSTDQAIYRSGEPIRITFEVFNHTPTSVRFDFTSSQRYDIVIEDQQGKEIWRWSADRMFTMALGQETLGPAKPRLTYKVEYTAKLESGTHKITSLLTDANRQISATISVDVQ